MASKLALLDVNMLISLLDEEHQHHSLVRDWFKKWIKNNNRWASCPITQNGCLRILSLPKYPNPIGLKGVKHRLTVATQHPSHSFIHDNISLLQDELINWQRIQGAKQLTDAYLLALAKHNGAVFVSLDNRIDTTTAVDIGDEYFLSLLN